MYTARVATCDEEEENDKIQKENGKKRRNLNTRHSSCPWNFPSMNNK